MVVVLPDEALTDRSTVLHGVRVCLYNINGDWGGHLAYIIILCSQMGLYSGC